MRIAGSFALAAVLVDGASWRWVMLIDAPVALIVILGVVRTAPALPAAGRLRWGLGSALLVTAALGPLVLAFDRASAQGWAEPLVWALPGRAVVLMSAFVRRLRRSANPLIPPLLLTDRQLLAAFLAVFVTGIGLFAGMYILTAYLQGVLGYSALMTGPALLPFGLSAVATSQLLSVTSARARPGLLLFLGLLLVAAAIRSFTVLGAGSVYTTNILPAMLLLGAVGTTVMITGSNAATFGAGADSGIASTVVNSG